MTAWVDSPPTTGCVWGAQKPPTAEAIVGRNCVTTFSTTYNFDPTNPVNQTGNPNVNDWNNSYNGTSFGHNVAMLVNILGNRSSDATTTTLAGVAGSGSGSGTTPTIRNIANNWTVGDNSYEDKCIRGWGAILKNLTQPTLCRMWHEPDTSDWYGDPTYFVPAWRKVYNYIMSVAPNVRFIWCPNGDLAASPPVDHAQYNPGSAYVHWYGVDAYSNRVDQHYTGLSKWYASFNPTNGTLNPDHKPIMICEWGLAQANTDRMIIFDELKGLLTTTYKDIKAMTYWTTQATASVGITDVPKGFLSDYQTWAKSNYMNPAISWSGTGPLPITVNITNPTAGAQLSTQTVLIQAQETTGNPIRNASLTVNGSTSQAMTFNSATQRWEKSISAPVGSVTVVVTITGTDGGLGTDTVNFTVSVVGAAPPPAISVLDPIEGQALTTPNYTVTADVYSTVGINASTVQISVDNGVTWQTMTAVPPGAGG